MSTQHKQWFQSGILLAIAGTFLFSLKPIVIKEAYTYDLSSIQLLTLRMLFAAPIYLIFAVIYWHKKAIPDDQLKTKLPQAAMLGFLGYYLASFTDMEALQHISAQLERIVLFCFPTLVVILSSVIFKTKPPKNIGWVIGISYLGIVLIFGHDLINLGSNVLLGTSLVFVSALAFAVYVTFSKSMIQLFGSKLFTAIAMLSAAVVIFTHFALTQSWRTLIQPIEVYGWVLTLAVLCTVVPSFMVASAIAKIGPEKTSVIGTIGPVFTSIIAVFWLGEAFTLFHFTGLCLVCFAIALMGRSK